MRHAGGGSTFFARLSGRNIASFFALAARRRRTFLLSAPHQGKDHLKNGPFKQSARPNSSFQPRQSVTEKPGIVRHRQRVLKSQIIDPNRQV